MTQPSLDAAPLVELPVGTPAYVEAMETGTLEHGGRRLAALPQALHGEGDAQRVSFRLLPLDAIERPGAAQRYAMAIRAISLTATLTPCVAVLLYGLWLGYDLRPFVALSAGLGAVLLQVAVNVFNDVEDHLKLIDLPGAPGGSMVIQRGWVSAREMRRLGFACLAAGALLGVPALVANPGIILLAGLGGVLGALGYSGAPLRLKYRALGDVAVLLLCGPLLTLGFGVAAFGVWDPGNLVIGLFFGFAAMAILHANNLEDIPLDSARDARTVAGVMGFERARYGLGLLYLATFAAPLIGALLGLLPWAPGVAVLLLSPMALRMASRAAGARRPTDDALKGLRFETAQYHLLLGVALCVGLGVSLGLA